LEAFRLEDVTAAIGAALARGTIGFDVVKHLWCCAGSSGGQRGST